MLYMYGVIEGFGSTLLMQGTVRKAEFSLAAETTHETYDGDGDGGVGDGEGLCRKAGCGLSECKYSVICTLGV
jgi:hypothetical protein